MNPSIHDEIGDVPGVCAEFPGAIRSMALVGLTPVRFTDDGFAPESSMNYAVTVDATTYIWQTQIASNGPEDIALPSDASLAPYVAWSFFGFAFDVMVAATEGDLDFRVSCSLVFETDGGVSGGSLRGPDRVLCSTTEGQFPGDPGLLVEFEQLCSSPDECPSYAPSCTGGVCAPAEANL